MSYLQETATQNEVAKLLQGFVESSSVGEFKTRLELLCILYEAIKHGDKGKKFSDNDEVGL